MHESVPPWLQWAGDLAGVRYYKLCDAVYSALLMAHEIEGVLDPEWHTLETWIAWRDRLMVLLKE